MKVLRTLYHLMRADLFERSRRYSFLITIGLVIFVAYLYVPPSDAGYLTCSLGNHRGIYNSAWIGASVAMLCSMFLSLPAFYLVKNAIARDERTRVGQIIATTPLSKPMYTLGKAFSSFVFLSVMVGVIALAAAGMQLVRGEVLRLEPWPLLSPFIFSTLPAMAMIAAVAIIFETLPLLRGTVGNVVYVFLWMAAVSLTAFGWPSDPQRIAEPVNDLLGTSVLVTDMMKAALVAFPGYAGENVGVGVFPLPAPLETYTWGGVHWTAGIIAGRLMWVAAAIGLSLVAALFFRRFDPAPLGRRKPGPAPERGVSQPGETDQERVAAAAAAVRLSPLASGFRPRFAALLAAELRLMLKGVRWWWYVVALGLILLGLLAPFYPDQIVRYALPVAWLWPLPLWSSLGCREARHRAQQLVFSAPRLLPRQLPALWLSGVLLALATGSGVAARFLVTGEPARLLAWGVGAVFIPTLALALGTLSSSNMLFEVVYVLWWYLGTIQGAAPLDFMGATGQAGATPAMYGIGTFILLGLAVLGRRRQAQVG